MNSFKNASRSPHNHPALSLITNLQVDIKHAGFARLAKYISKLKEFWMDLRMTRKGSSSNPFLWIVTVDGDRDRWSVIGETEGERRNSKRKKGRGKEVKDRQRGC